MEGLAALIELLSLRIDDTGAWSLTSDELRLALGASPVTFWRAVHAQRARIALTDAIDGFTQDTVGDLVTLLEELVGGAAEGSLARAGLFVPHYEGVELTEEFLTGVGRFCAAHEVRTEELEAMIRHAGSVRGAVSIYLGEHFDREALIAGCAERFQAGHRLPEAGRATAERYLRGLFSRHILDPRSVVSVLEARLKLAAANMGFVDPEERFRAGSSRERAEGSSRGGARRKGGRAWAIEVMGLDETNVDAEALRARYRHLMMRHHPDVDPAGLERCKDINVAYSLLMTS